MRKIICLMVFVFWTGMLWSQEVWENKTYIYDGFFKSLYRGVYNPGYEFRFSRRIKNLNASNDWLENNNFRLDLGQPLNLDELDYDRDANWADFGQTIKNVEVGEYKTVKDELYTYVVTHGTKYLVLASKNGEVTLLVDLNTSTAYWGADENSLYCATSLYSTRIPTINNKDYISPKLSSFLSETLKGVRFNYDAGQIDSATGLPYYGFKYTILRPWVEGVKGDGIGEWEAVPISKNPAGDSVDLVFFNGYIKPEHPDYFYNNNRVKELTASYGNREFTITLEDSPNPQIIKLPKDFIGNEVRFTIKSVYKGKKYDDTALANIALFYYNQE